MYPPIHVSLLASLAAVVEAPVPSLVGSVVQPARPRPVDVAGMAESSESGSERESVGSYDPKATSSDSGDSLDSTLAKAPSGEGSIAPF